MNEYGKLVKHRLIDLNKTQSWLIEQITERTGCFCDSAYLSRILSGERNAPKIRAAINEILSIE